MKKIQLRQYAAGLLCSSAILAPAHALAAGQVRIPAGALSTALETLSRQSGAEIIYDAEDLRGLRSRPVAGDVSPAQAVRRMIGGTRLVVHTDPSGAMLIAAGDSQASAPRLIRVATVERTAAAAPVQASEPAGIEEVIVTARKRAETLLSVPVVITAINQQQLEKYQTQDFYALSARVPGLVVGNQVSVIGPGVTLRGVGTTALNATIDQSVSLNVDGLQLSSGFAYQAAMFDVGQVEVMKGPQPLFYGKNSPAGVISLRSADPTGEAEIVVRAGYEAVANEKYGSLVLSGPVSDSLKLRLATYYGESDGFFRNRDTAPLGVGVRSPTTIKNGTEQNFIIRGTALFNPSDRYDARLKVNYTRRKLDNGGGDTQYRSCPGGLTSFTGRPVFDPNEDCTLNRDMYVSWPDRSAFPFLRNGGVPYVHSRSEFGTLEQNMYFGPLTLTSVTGYYKYAQKTLVSGAGTSGLSPFFTDNDFYNRQFTQEVRLTSDYDGRLNFMLGGFYQDGRLKNHPRTYGNIAIGQPAILRDVVHDIAIESSSAFGQLTFDLTDTVELAGGARFTHEARDHKQWNIASVGVPVGPVIGIDPRLRSNNVSPEASLTWRPSTDLTMFATYKQGFKSGSFNSSSYIAPTTLLSFGDEKVKSGELGLKSRLFDRTLGLNLSAYYARFSGLQVGSIEITPQGVLVLRTINAASAKVRGIDFDFTYAPPAVEGLTLSGSLAYNRATYGSFKNAPCGNNQTISQGCNQVFNSTTGRFNAQDLTGRPLARAPRWTSSGGIDYETPVGADMRLSFGATATYTSKFYTNIIDLPAFIQPSYVKFNASLALKGADDAWEVALLGNNLGNKITSGFCANGNANGALVFGGQVSGAAVGGPAGDDYPSCSPERGREVWLRLTFRPLARR